MAERYMNDLNGHIRTVEEQKLQELFGQRRLLFVSFCMFLLSFFCSGCYNNHRHRVQRDLFPRLSQSVDSLPDSTSIDSVVWRRMADSLRFLSEHHYSENFNFVVRADSLLLLRQQPEEVLSLMPVDSFYVRRYDPLVVADIRILPTDSIDSVWVSVARDQYTFGWIHEKDLLPAVDPDDPISQFITTFSDTHVLIFLIVIGIIAAAYLFRYVSRKNAWIVHFKDISSFYPTALVLLVATSATLYASIQMFAPEMWRHFYFNPTLNPFSVPPVLMVFLILVWLMLIMALASVEVVRLSLPSADAMVYLMGLAGVCTVNYIVFSITTLYYIGYPLLLAYICFALYTYIRRSHCRFVCGQCGAPMHEKGRCAHCGAMNE